jgi:hypothetical protein
MGDGVDVVVLALFSFSGVLLIIDVVHPAFRRPEA